MPIIPLTITIVKLLLTLGFVAIGIRCLFIQEPKTDNFAFDVRRLIHIRGMSRRKFWIRTGVLFIFAGLLFSYFLFF